MLTIALVLAGWTLLSLPLGLVVGRVLAGAARRQTSYAVTVDAFTTAPDARVETAC